MGKRKKKRKKKKNQKTKEKEAKVEYFTLVKTVLGLIVV